MVLQGVNLEVSKVRGLGQRPMPGACFLCGKEGFFKWEWPRLSCASYVGEITEEGLPLKMKVSVETPQAQDQDWWDISIMAPVLITTQEPWVILNVGRQPIDFLLNMRATFLSSSPILGPSLMNPPHSYFWQAGYKIFIFLFFLLLKWIYHICSCGYKIF